MTPERWQQVDKIFQAAIELNARERAVFLETSCAGDQQLRNEVESLISSDAQGLSLIDDPAFEVAAGLIAGDGLELKAGQRLGNYEILGSLGVGGMGEVYLAEDASLGRKIALKLLPADFTRSEERLRRFRQEARAASALNHPNILTIHEIKQIEDRYFIATEFVDGETLRQRLKRSRLRPTEALEIATQVGSALAAAHQAGIIHRDVKPENIMLRRDGYVKVLDFGLAKSVQQPFEPSGVDAARRVDTIPGLIMGTVKYMSPEQARGLEVDARSDVFSFGVVLYEMIAGRAPFEGETNSDIIAALLKEEPPPLTEHAPGIPKQLERLINKALRKRKEDRYQTIPELLADLKNLREDEAVSFGGIQASVQTISGFELPTTDVEALPTLSGAEYVRAIKSHKAMAALILVAMAIVIVGVTVGPKRFLNRLSTSTQGMKIARIPNTEKSVQAAFSPDGKYVAHVVADKNQASIWIRQLGTNTDLQLVPADNFAYAGLTFSKDGSEIFYTRHDGFLYQVPVVGGDSRKVLTDVSGPVSFAPDGERFAFVRELSSEETALMIGNVNGGGEQILTRRKRPQFLSSAGPAWSPDGSLIACAFGTIAGNREMGIVGIELSTGHEKPITDQKWQLVDRLAWLADGSGLITPITETGPGPSQIWHIPYTAGQPRPVTHDLNNYTDLSLTADSRSLVTVQFEQRNSLWIVPNGDTVQAKPLNASKHDLYRVISWTPDGRILYSSNIGANRDIWIMNGDGTNPRQLTTNAGNNLQPYASPDGRYIVFSSNRAKAGAFNIWRMDIDGSNPRPLTHGNGEVGAICSPDGRWVVYSKGGPETQADAKTLWKVPIDGGDPVPLTTSPSSGPDISPDGTLVATWYKQDAKSPWQIALIPLAGGSPIKTFDVKRTSIFRLRWKPDGQSITYINTREGVSNIWEQLVSGGPPRQLTHFTSEQIEGFDWSRDGRLICSRGFTATDVVVISDFK